MATLLGNGVTVALTVLQPFLIIPLSLASMGPQTYAAWLAASEVLVWIQMLDGGLPNLLTQRTGALVGQGDWRSAASWSSTTFLWLVVAGGLLLVSAHGLAPLLADGLSVSETSRAEFISCFRIAALASVLLLLSNGAVALSRGVQNTAGISTMQVAGAAFGLVASLVLLMSGWGLWALAYGMLVRAAMATAGAVWLLLRLSARGCSWLATPSRALSREIARLLPSMIAGNVAYALGNNSEVLLATALLGPAPALAYALTRRAVDGVRSLLDTVAWAVAGGFAHLTTGSDRHRARAIFHEILWLRVGMAVVGLGTVVAVNQAFVSLLFGAPHFAGVLLTTAFAVQAAIAGHSFLLNYLWRATGRVKSGSILLAIEATARMALMGAGLYMLGPVGAPVAASIVSLGACIWLFRRIDVELPCGNNSRVARTYGWGLAAIGVTAVGIALLRLPLDWRVVGLVATAFHVFGGWLLWRAQPAHTRNAIVSVFRRRPA